MAPLALALEIDGAGSHPEAWRRAASAPDRHLDPQRLRHLGETVERAGFTIATLEDDLLPPLAPAPLGRIGAIERAAFLAEITSALALVPVVSTTYTEPFHVSSSLAALDHISHGRTGWIIASTPHPAAARAWDRPVIADAQELRREAADGLHVSRALWDSWEDDAVIRDVTTSRYLDRDRLHYIDFEGATYSVKGPSTVPRPPQGHVVTFAAPDLVDPGQVDVALLGAGDIEGVTAAAAAAAGAPRHFAEIDVALDEPEQTAAERVAALDAVSPWPDRGRLRYVGPADGLVRLLTDLAAHVDGVRLHPLVIDEDLAVLSKLVVPRLIVERTSARPIAGQSLRATLGLARPHNQFAAVAAVPGG